MACDMCSKKVSFQAGKYVCDNSTHHVTSARYKLSFVAADDTADALFFCHHDMARQLVRKSCSQLVGPFQVPTGLPPALTNVINKTFTFGVTLSDESFRGMQYRKYKVRSILSHPDVQQIPPQLPPIGPIVPHPAPIVHAENTAGPSRNPGHQQVLAASGSNTSSTAVVATSEASREELIGHTDGTGAVTISRSSTQNVMSPQTPAAQINEKTHKELPSSTLGVAPSVRRALVMPAIDDDVNETTIDYGVAIPGDSEVKKQLDANTSEDTDLSPSGPRKRAKGGSTKQMVKTSTAAKK